MAIERISIEIKSNAKDTEKQLSNIDARIKELNSKKANIQLRADNLAETKKKIDSIDVAIKQLQARKAEVKVSGESADVARSKMKELQRSIDILRAQKAKLQVDTQQLKGADKEVNALEREMTSLNNKKARLQVEQQEIGETENALEELSAKLKKIDTQKTEINISSNIEQIGGKIDNLGSKMLKSLNTLGSKLNQLVGLGAALKLIDSVVGAVTNSVDGAISRYDTLNNFPKVMSNLKISEDDAAASINKLSEELTGLPTTLNDAAASVQRFTSGNRDIEKSTDMFLALNNAILAGGAESGLQSSALEQLSQAYAKGKPDAVEWRSIINAMPAQVAQIGEAFGVSGDELGEALRYGNISMDEFMEKIVELNKEGANGYKSFAEQAKNATGGISTSLTVMRTRITSGLTGFIEKIDGVLGKTKLGSLSEVFVNIGNSFKSGFDKIGTFVDENEDKIVSFVDTVQDKASALWEGLKKFDWADFGTGLKEGFGELKDAAVSLWETISPIIGFIKDRITDLGGGSFAKGLGKLPSLFVKVAFGAKILGKALKLFGGLSNFKLPFGGSSKGSGGLSFNFDAGKALNQVKNLALVFGVVKIIQEAAQALKDIDEKVPDNISDMSGKFANMAIALGGMGAFVVVAGKLADKNTSAAIKGLAAIALISVDLMLAAEALRQIDEKVPSSLGDMGGKFANMAIALGGMGVIVAAAGALASKFPATAVAGLLAVAGISGDLMLAAEALGQIDEKVPSSILGMQAKFASMALVLGEMGAIVTVVGALMATGIGAVFVGLGLAAVAGVAGDLILAADAIQDVNEKVPSDITGVKAKIGAIAEAIGYFTESNFGSILGMFENAISGWNITAVSAGMSKMADIAKTLEKFDEFEIPDNIEDKIEDIKDIIELFDGATWEELLKDIMGAADLYVVEEAFEKFHDIGNLLVTFNEIIIPDDTKAKVKQIQKTLELFKGSAWNDLLKHIVGTADLDVLEDAFAKFNDIARLFKRFENVEFDKEIVKTQINDIKDIIELISSDSGEGGKGGLGQKIAGVAQDVVGWLGDSVNAGSFEEAKNAIGEILDIAQKLKGINESGFVFKDAKTKITDIQTIIDQFSSSGLIASIDFLSNADSFDGAKDKIDSLISLTESIWEIAGTTLFVDTITAKLDDVKTVLKRIAREDFVNAAKDAVKSKFVENAKESVDNLVAVIKKLQTINGALVNAESITITLGMVEQVANALTAFPNFSDRSYDLSQLKLTSEYMVEIINLLQPLNKASLNSENAIKAIDEVEKVVNKLNDFPDAKDINSVVELVNSFSGLITQLNDLAGQFEPVGEGYGEQVISGFKNADVPGGFIGVIDEAIKKLEGKVGKFKEIGKKYGDALKNAFADKIKNLSVVVSDEITDLLNYKIGFGEVGDTFGQSLLTAFKDAIAGMGTGISDQVDSVQKKLNTLTVPNLSSNIGIGGGTAGFGIDGFANGGAVQYRAGGGLTSVFKPKGTDTVPAMLTPGEFVQRREAVNKFGAGFMNRINNLDISGALRELTSGYNSSSMIPAVSTVINNVNTDNRRSNNARVVQNIQHGSQNFSLRRAGRWVKGL